MKKTFIALILVGVNLVFIAGAAFVFVPWKAFIAERIAQELKSNGLPNATLSLTALGFNTARIENLQFGEGDSPLTITELTAHYDVQEVQRGKLQSLLVNGLSITLIKGEAGWSVEGWPNKTNETQTPLVPPLTPEYKNVIPADLITLESGTLSIKAPAWTLTAPLAGAWQKNANPDITVKPSELFFEGGGVKLSGLLEASASLNAEKKKWEGSWSLTSLNIYQQGAQEDIAPADLSGTLSADEKSFILSGTIKGKAKAYDGAFLYTYPFADPNKATLSLTNFSMPWQGGTLLAKDVTIPLTGNKPYTLNLKIAKASVGKLLQDFTGEYVKATGTISGTFPLKIGQDGKITVGKGTLSADAPGQLSMPPEAIPGEGSQMQLTRDILQQFDYKLLSLVTEQQDKGGLAIQVRIEGNNPKVENGRPVILNIRLTGDLLDFITSSAIVFTSPQTLIKQGNK